MNGKNKNRHLQYLKQIGRSWEVPSKSVVSKERYYWKSTFLKKGFSSSLSSSRVFLSSDLGTQQLVKAKWWYVKSAKRGTEPGQSAFEQIGFLCVLPISCEFTSGTTGILCYVLRLQYHFKLNLLKFEVTFHAISKYEMRYCARLVLALHNYVQSYWRFQQLCLSHFRLAHISRFFVRSDSLLWSLTDLYGLISFDLCFPFFFFSRSPAQVPTLTDIAW